MAKKKVRKKKPRSVADVFRLISIVVGTIVAILAIIAIIMRYYQLVSKH